MKRRASLFLLAMLGWVCAWAAAAQPMLVRTAAQNSQPKFLLEGEHIGGLCVDVFKAIERIDPSLKFSALDEFVPLPRIEQQMADGNYDLFCGLAKTALRRARFDFIDIPIYLTHSVLAARMDDKADVKNFDDLRKLGDDGIVLVAAKTVHADVLARQGGITYFDTAMNTAQNLHLLMLGRGRFIFHSDFALAEEIKSAHLGDKVKILPVKFLTEGRYIALSKRADPALREKIGAAMEKMRKSGELARIYQAYKP